jgi:hypothetical protein
MMIGVTSAHRERRGRNSPPPFADPSGRYACNLLQKLAESFISPVFQTTESCKKLQKIAIPDRETRLIKALQADAAKKNSRGSLTLPFTVSEG